mgnify:CR=1 FL=1
MDLFATQAAPVKEKTETQIVEVVDNEPVQVEKDDSLLWNFSGIIAPKIVNAKVFYLFWLSFMALGIVGSLSDSFYENPVDGYASSLGYLLIYISFWKQNKGLLPRYSQTSEKPSV